MAERDSPQLLALLQHQCPDREARSALHSSHLVTLRESPSRYTVSVPRLPSHCSLGQGRLWKGNTPGSRSRRFRCSCIARRQGRFEFILCKQAAAATYVCVWGGGEGDLAALPQQTGAHLHTFPLPCSMHRAPTPAPMQAVKTCSVQGGLS